MDENTPPPWWDDVWRAMSGYHRQALRACLLLLIPMAVAVWLMWP